MATSYSPKIITDGLVLCLDAADKKSLLAPPTTNLANNSNGTINWTTADLGATVRTQSTVDANSYHYRFVLDKGSDNNAKLRFAFDHTNLTNGETYIMSYKYKITSGSGSFYITDFCDQSVTRVTTDIGDGWYYETAYGTRSSYTETHDFFDTLATENMTVDIKEIQVEHTSASSPLATPFVSYQRQWKDRAGSNNGAFVNMNDQSDFSSESRGSLIFDGTNDVVGPSTFDYDDSGGSFTVCAWLNPDTFTSSNSYAAIINRTDNSNHIFSVFIETNYGSGTTGELASWFFDTGGAIRQHKSSGNCVLNLNEWNFCVWRFSDAAGYTYDLFNSDGVVNNTSSATQSIRKDSTSQFTIGRWRGGSYYFNGQMSNIKSYNKKLTNAEVLQNYNATKGRFGL